MRKRVFVPKIIRNLLEPGERIVLIRRLHWIYVVSGWVMCVSIAAFGWGMVWLFYKYLSSNEFYTVDIYGWILVMQIEGVGWVFTIAGLTYLISEYIQYWTIGIFVTNQRLIYKTGLIKINLDETDLIDTRSVHVNQGWFGWLFDYGRIHINCYRTEDIFVPFVRRPYRLIQVIHTLKNRMRRDIDLAVADSYRHQTSDIQDTPEAVMRYHMKKAEYEEDRPQSVINFRDISSDYARCATRRRARRHGRRFMNDKVA